MREDKGTMAVLIFLVALCITLSIALFFILKDERETCHNNGGTMVFSHFIYSYSGKTLMPMPIYKCSVRR